MFPIPCFCSARLALFSRFRVFAALLPIQVPIIGPERQVAFRCMGIRGQEIWAGPHGQTEETREDRRGGIFADADAIAAVKFGDAPSY